MPTTASGAVVADSPMSPPGAETEGVPLLNQSEVRELAGAVASVGLQTSADDPELLLALDSLMPTIEKFEPAIGARLKQRIAQSKKNFTEQPGEEDAPDSDIVNQHASQDAPPPPRTRAALVGELAAEAVTSAERGDGERALILLDKARGMIDQPVRSPEQLGAQIHLARAYASLSEAGQAFTLAEPLVYFANDFAAALPAVVGFLTGGHLMSDDELSLPHAFDALDATLNDHGFELLNLLAEANFERAKTLTDVLQRREVRIAARLLLARAALTASRP